MEETITIQPIQRSEWNTVIQGFDPVSLKTVLKVYADGQGVGIVCEEASGKAYINGQPDRSYANLQVAATALIKAVQS